ncbi:hypothetical protein E1212_11945 [Jiangella ureilytica]|uniref:Uncharacterized protein n=1 Tax=Jiangella ureilytica TaxID=2530374 RepID=A0A4R4RNX8_9ACTN|nr:hypothetical protein [Jiangella ureilytica]TDC51487.1 hypothetical protein E1212_11945 [Jiangella ureilytica]
MAALAVVLVLLVTTLVIVIWYQWRQGEQEVLDEQAAEAEIMRGRLERNRDAGEFDEAVGARLEDIVEDLVTRTQDGELVSVTERPDDLQVVAVVGVPPAIAISAQSGVDKACFEFTVPPSPAPVIVERLSPDEGRWPDECYGFSS